MRKRSPSELGKVQHRVLYPTGAHCTLTINVSEIRVRWVVHKDEPSRFGNTLPHALVEN